MLLSSLSDYPKPLFSIGDSVKRPEGGSSATIERRIWWRAVLTPTGVSDPWWYRLSDGSEWPERLLERVN